MPTTKEMKTWTIDGSDVVYEIVDEKARRDKADTTYVNQEVAKKQNLLKGAAGQFVGFDENGEAIPQVIPGSSVLLTVQAPAGSWADNMQTIQDAGILEGDQYVYILGLDDSAQAAYSGGPIWADAVTTNGEMTLRTKMEQTVDLTLNILRVEVKNG